MTKRNRRPARPVTIDDVDRFLDSPVARRYHAFSDSNVKRQVIRLLLFLREEVDRLERQLGQGSGSAPAARPAPRWVERVSKSSRR